MVAAVRAGQSQRAVARRFKVPLRGVQYWLERAAGQPLHAVDWADRSSAPHQPALRTSAAMERRVVAARHELQQSPLGFVGAEAIAEALAEGPGAHWPSVRTIGRILHRYGLLDGRRRTRQLAPPPGWYLPDVAAARAELDLCDVVEDLRIEGGPLVSILTTRALWGPTLGAWPAENLSARFVLQTLQRHWSGHGLPDYVQFDNDTRFQGPHSHPDVLGRVIRFCLSLEVTPVFAPPAEHGFQNANESFNSLWLAKVWHRFHHASLAALRTASARFVQAYYARRRRRIERAPRRHPWPTGWQLDLQARPRGQVLFLRRTDEHGQVSVLGHRWTVDPCWSHRLVRAEVDLDRGQIRFYALRRKAPQEQRLLKTAAYKFPHRKFHTD